MQQIINVFLNKKWIIFDTEKSILVNSPRKIHEKEKAKIGIWVNKKFVYDAKYDNQICIGINNEEVYKIFKYQEYNNSKVIEEIAGNKLVELFEKRKKQNKIDYFTSFKKNK